MHTKIVAFLVLLLTNCQSHQNTFQLEGKWVDMACMDTVKNCKSRYPEIIIDFEMINPEIGREYGLTTNGSRIRLN
jgi:hypothetical protein